MDNWARNNNILKALSLVLAIMLWLVVSMDGNVPTKQTYEEEVQNTYLYEAKVTPIYNENEFIIEMLTDQVYITLNGERTLINQIRDGKNIDKGQFFVDLTNYKPGTYEVPIQYTGFPDGVNIEISPKLITVQIEAKQRKEFAITVDKLGTEGEGYQTGEPIIKPKRVHVSGTKEQIDKVAFIKAFINIDKVEAPILQQVPLRAFDKNGNVVEVDINPQIIEVQIPVTSPFSSVPITYQLNKFPQGDLAVESINQLTKDVTIYGPKNIIEQYTIYNGLMLDLSEIGEGEQTISLKIPVDEGLLKVEPEFMELNVNIVKAETKTFNHIKLDINGLSDGLKAEITTPKDGVDIILKGAPKVLETLTNNDLQAFMDLTNLPPGEYEVRIQFNIPLLTKRVGTEETAVIKITEE